MVDTTLSPGQSVDNDRHDHHHRHPGEGRDGGDDASLLLTSPAEGMPDDPVTIIDGRHRASARGCRRHRRTRRGRRLLHPARHRPAQLLRLRHKAKETNKGCLVTELDKAVQQSLPGGSDEPSALDELVALARAQCQLKHDADRNAVAVIPMPGRQEVWRVYSTGFEEWLRSAYWRAKEAGVAATTMKSALATIAAAGINDGEQIDLHVRAAKDEAGYLIDLCDEHWRAVLVTPRGWQVLDRSPACFTRTQAMRPLPEPQRGGDIGLLWQHANIPSDRRVMVLTWLLDSFRPAPPFRCWNWWASRARPSPPRRPCCAAWSIPTR